jgi:hypothetical protein
VKLEVISFRSNILLLNFQNIVYILKMEEGGCPRTLVTKHYPDYTLLVNQYNQHLNHGRRDILRFLIPDKFFDIWDISDAGPTCYVVKNFIVLCILILIQAWNW